MLRLCRKSERGRERRNAEHSSWARLCTSGFHFHPFLIFRSKHCSSIPPVRPGEFNQRAPDPALRELWG